MRKREAVLLPLFSNPVFLDAMERLTNSAEQYDARASLKDITAKTLIVGSDEDYLTPLNNQKLLHKEITNSEFVIIPGAGHASMYEKPLTFISLILGFVNAKQETFII
jgi:pimeloyl-ACP methyl ester carboxylesterase